jgi:hypothetical protein
MSHVTRTTDDLSDQLSRSLQEPGRGRDAASAPGPVGRALERAGYGLVETRRRLRAMPCSPIGVRPRIRRFGQRAVHLLAILRGCRPVDRRAHERMPEPHADPSSINAASSAGLLALPVIPRYL